MKFFGGEKYEFYPRHFLYPVRDPSKHRLRIEAYDDVFKTTPGVRAVIAPSNRQDGGAILRARGVIVLSKLLDPSFRLIADRKIDRQNF